jgi:hypothetical protein
VLRREQQLFDLLVHPQVFFLSISVLVPYSRRPNVTLERPLFPSMKRLFCIQKFLVIIFLRTSRASLWLAPRFVITVIGVEAKQRILWETRDAVVVAGLLVEPLVHVDIARVLSEGTRQIGEVRTRLHFWKYMVVHGWSLAPTCVLFSEPRIPTCRLNWECVEVETLIKIRDPLLLRQMHWRRERLIVVK